MIKKIKEKFNQRKIRRAVHREQVRSMPTEYDNHVITWQAPEFVKHQRGLLWKITAPLAVVIASVFGFIYNAWTFSLAIMAFALAYYVFEKEQPKIVNVLISEVGIKVGHRKYPFGRIKAFWITYDPPFTKTLHIRVENDIARDIMIHLHEQKSSEVRRFLIKRIPELEGKTPTLTEGLLRLFKL
ncbi:MAG: hypothetical protein V1679_02990 [Candidatus Peregrinibacteria bacterium]